MSTEMFECELCGKKFDSKKKLNGHRGGAHYRKLVPIRHGTEWGYQQHIHRNKPPCARCKKIHRINMRKYRAGVRKQRASD